MTNILTERFEEMSLEETLKIIPPSVGLVIIIISVIVTHGNIGMLGVAILFSLLISFTPYTIHQYLESRRISALEDQFPNFLRDIVESKKSGMTLPQTIENASKNEYGRLTPVVKKMGNQLSLGLSFEEVFSKFRDRMEGSKLIQRSIRIIMEAKRSGGNVISTMETIASDAATIKEMEMERKSKMQQHSMVMYLIYLMFAGIAIMLSKILIPMTQMKGIGGGGGMGIGMGGGGLCTPIEAKVGAQKFVCSFFTAMSDIFGLGGGMGGYYKSLFLSMILVQGILSGLVIGQISENSPSAGIKHSLILTGVGFTAFLLGIRMGII